MRRKFHIHKAGGVVIRDRKLLVEKSLDKEFYIAPGGSVENGETSAQALIRELLEEFRIETQEEDLEIFGTFYAQAAGQEDKVIKMDVFMVKRWAGEPTACSEVESILWVNSKLCKKLKVGSIIEHQIIPLLKKSGLID